MWGLLLPTILASAADSLNPIAITQQFILQGMVKKPRDIWYFILPTGITNLIGGFLAYFGLVALIENFLADILTTRGFYFYVAEFILAIAFLLAGAFSIQSRKIKNNEAKMHETDTDEEEKAVAKKIKSVSPIALIAMGVGSTISELITALPYFAFLAILLNYELALLELTIILVLYNTIYTSPLAILYLVYRKAQNKFDALYLIIKRIITKWSNVLVPTVFFAIGVFLTYHSLSLLLP